MKRFVIGIALIASVDLAESPRAQGDYQQLGKSILKSMIETNTTGSAGNTTVLAQSMAKLFVDAGLPEADVQVVGPAERNKNLVVRYRGAGAHKPLLLMGHIDVVEALRSDWTVDPFVLTEQGGYYYGRGTQDMKGSAATLVAALLRLKSEGWQPDRDVIVALTSGEEGGSDYVGMQWLVEKQRQLIDAEYAINVDVGGGEIINGKNALMGVQAAEKVYHTVSLTVSNTGGHSSLPRSDNAIYSLAKALEKLAAYTFPEKPNEIVRAYFKQAAASAETPALAAAMRTVAAGNNSAPAFATLSEVPLYNALLRTTCVATMVQAGHAENALPATAKATVNCRILPGEDAVAVERTLVRIIGDTSVKLAPVASKSGAMRWGEDRERHLLQHGPEPPKKEVPMLREFAPRFLEEYAVANRQKPSTVASKDSILRIHLVPALGEKKLDAITTEEVQKLKHDLRDNSPKTVNNVLTVLNVMLKKAVEWQLIPEVPCNIKLVPVSRAAASFHDFDAYESLVGEAQKRGWRTHLIVLLGGEAGLRCGEMVALHWSDVDFVNRQLCVRHSDWKGELTAPKNGRWRYVPLTERLASALREYRHLRGPRVLCKDDGRPLSRQSAWTRVWRAVRRRNVPTGIHILRHTFCSHLAMRGAPGKAIQELAGHSELGTTSRYMHLSPAARESAIKLLEQPKPQPPRGDILESVP